LACVPYERMMVQCVNNYGFMNALKNQECAELIQHFTSCLNVNQALGTLKATQPEYFVSSEYSRDKPQFSEIKIWFLYENIYISFCYILLTIYLKFKFNQLIC
jgi:hypothetical protein